MDRRRIDYLAIDRSLLQRCSLVPPTKFALSIDGGWEIMPLDQKFPIAYAPAKQVLYSCNKIGASLFISSDAGFDLRDPYMHRSNATLEYNALYDPTLGSYYQQPAVRKCLKAQNLVNDRNDAICTKRFFFQYLKYLEGQRSAKLLNALTQQVSKRYYFGPSPFEFYVDFHSIRNE